MKGGSRLGYDTLFENDSLVCIILTLASLLARYLLTFEEIVLDKPYVCSLFYRAYCAERVYCFCALYFTKQVVNTTVTPGLLGVLKVKTVLI